MERFCNGGGREAPTNLFGAGRRASGGCGGTGAPRAVQNARELRAAGRGCGTCWRSRRASVSLVVPPGHLAPLRGSCEADTGIGSCQFLCMWRGRGVCVFSLKAPTPPLPKSSKKTLRYSFHCGLTFGIYFKSWIFYFFFFLLDSMSSFILAV